MPCESKSWRPAHWTVTKRHQFEEHTWRRMEWQLEQWWGAYEGARRAAELRGHRLTLQSIEGLRNAGVRTLGEV